MSTQWIRDMLGTAGMVIGIVSLFLLAQGNWEIARAERERRSRPSGDR